MIDNYVVINTIVLSFWNFEMDFTLVYIIGKLYLKGIARYSYTTLYRYYTGISLSNCNPVSNTLPSTRIPVIGIL